MRFLKQDLSAVRRDVVNEGVVEPREILLGGRRDLPDTQLPADTRINEQHAAVPGHVVEPHASQDTKNETLPTPEIDRVQLVL
jgi:hypothetical protein